MNNSLNTLLNKTSVKPGTRVLFANVPADGHFNPLTGLAAHLKEKGCDVRWYTSPVYREKISRLGITFYGMNKALDVAATAGDMEALFPEREKIKGQVAKLKHDMINVFILRSPEYYEDIADIYQSFPFEIMIADVTFGGIPYVQEKMNIPVIAVNIIPNPETSKDLPPPGLGMTPSNNFVGRIKQNLLRFVAGKLLFAGPNKVMKQTLAKHGISTNGAGIFDVIIQKSTAVLQSGTPGFEYKRSDMSSHIHFAGPLLPYSKKQQAAAWYDPRLGKYEKVILVTQGTVEKDVEKLIIPTLEAFNNTDYLVIVTTGGSMTAELREKYQAPNFIIEDFIPFNDVMPYADVYITNGGYGGVLLSIKNQLPMVAAGVHEGKNEINARIGYFKLGVNLKTELPKPSQLRSAVETIMKDPVYAENVKKLCDEFNSYNPNQVCEELVSKLTGNRQGAVVGAIRETELIY